MRYLKIAWNKLVIFISDVYYYHHGDRSSMYDHKLSVGLKPSWRDRCRNPIMGKFKKFLF